MEPPDVIDVTSPSFQSVGLILNGTESRRTSDSNNSVKLWKRALRKLQAVDLDPWLDFPTYDIPVQTATRHRYSAIKKKWVVDEIFIKLETRPFDHGAMRECFRLKKLSQGGSNAADWQRASNYVAKRYISKVDKQVYFDDVRLQMEAKLWGEAFNRQNPPKKVDIFQLSVIELRPCESKQPPDSMSDLRFYHIERYMEGEYRKYNSNSGFVDEQLRNTPQAFSHFTFERSGHRLLVVDIQGVGDLYTDPQIHTSDGVGYSDGNLGPKGMAYFFHSHRCNPLCEYLGLTPFDLAPSELQDQSGPNSSPPENKSESMMCAGSPSECQIPTDEAPRDVENRVDNKPKEAQPFTKHASIIHERRRRSVSFSQPSTFGRFGPTVARSTESMRGCVAVHPRRRTNSTSVVSDGLPSNASDELTVENLFGLQLVDNEPISSMVAVKFDESSDKLSVPFRLPTNSHSTFFGVESYPKPLMTSDLCGRTHLVRDRISSGDSGYSGLIHFRAPSASGCYENQAIFTHCLPAGDLFHGSTSSLTDLSFPTSPSPLGSSFVGAAPYNTISAADEELNLSLPLASRNPIDWFSNGGHRFVGPFGGLLPRRHRNLSESSDLDVEEDRRMAGNLLHQLMHESHKPSCAAHPTNLDQEIGQSVLGQIHHELARLHEGGKFLPTCKGGWSHAGLGGLLLKNHADSMAESDAPESVESPHPSDQQVDWAAVLFHERHAAQLSCLEAMIVMAHYHLGLPTQLLLDCPIKPAQNDLRSGVDYLWRAAEGGDRRCMILLARYLDVSATMSDPSKKPNSYTNAPRDILFLPMLHDVNVDMLPSVSPDSWAEAITWYQKAVDTACTTSNGQVDEGLDAEGGYDAAEDLLPVYRILGRMAEMYSTGGFGLKPDFNRAGDLFNRAGELALTAFQGRLATNYFDLSEESYAKIQ